MKSKNKKSLIRLSALVGSIGVLAAVPILTTACGETTYDAILVLDEGTVTDQSFNQSSYEAMQDYQKQTKGFSITHIEPKQGATTADFQRTYDVANSRLKGPKLNILSGFMHPQTGEIFNYLKNHKSTNYIGVDFDETAAGNTTKPANFAGVNFNAVQSGFETAMWTGLFFNLKEKSNIVSTPTINVATFGGQAFPTVTNYMDGLQLGVHYFNTHKTDIGVGGDFVDAPKDMAMVYQNATSATDHGTPSESDFSGDFSPSNQKVQQMSKNYFNVGGATALLPVAGPQASSAVSVAATLSNKYIYGIDVDMTKVDTYKPQQQQFILGSAIKNIRGAVFDMMKHVIEGGKPGSVNTSSKTYGVKDQKAENGLYYVGFTPNETYGTAQVENTITNNSLWLKNDK